MTSLPRADAGYLARIGAAFTALRERRGLSQNELAERSGIAQGTISRVESGVYEYEIGTLVRLLNVLGREWGDFGIDAGFTDEQADYADYEFVIRLKAKRLRSVSGNVTGPGMRRAK